ncbi:MAG TPA: hypothetical protein VG755_41480 [Nannocystaceae bacterium]|nr:hypothetical protein [Nannocystaceae bacterium]
MVASIACGSSSSDSRGGEAGSGITNSSLTSIGSAGSEGESGSGGSGSAEQGTGGTMASADETAGPSSNSNDDDGPKFDLGTPDGGVGCEGGGGDTSGDGLHSFIWIANSGQGTVSKINTQTMVEEGRYIVRPDSAGNPSRTSVALTGNVAVANRAGGVVKIYANPDDCAESNGMAGLQTSSGAADILPWGTEECIAWYTAFDYTTQRPVAWAAGEWNNSSCSYVNEKLWTAGGYNAGVADVLLLDGETGVVENMVSIPSVIGWAQLYGGAVDPDGNFWTVDHNWDGASTLIRVNRSDMSYDTWPVTGQVHYGLTVDPEGRAWLCGNGGASRFDPVPETWTHLAPLNAGSALGGCMTDGQGTLWHSPYPNAQLVGIDTETVSIVETIPIPAYVHGVSIDFDGNVWGVEFSGTRAFRVDPNTMTVDTYDGLVGAYTYSDMTGFQLSSVGPPTG